MPDATRASPSPQSAKDATTSTPTLCMDRVNAVLSAVQLRVPAEGRIAFDEAWKVAPHVVLYETDPLRFLRLESGNVEAAARRLAQHWTQRREVFGHERFTRFVNVTGDGALAAADVDLLKHIGFVCPVFEDAEYTGVYFDVSRVGQHGLERSFRCLFHLACQAWKKEKPVVIIRYSESPNLNKQKMQKLLGTFDAMSLKVARILCVFKPQQGTKHIFDSAVAPLLEGFVGEFQDRGVIFKSIICDDPSELLPQLLAEGLRPESLPVSVGGELRQGDVAASYAARARMDRFLSFSENLMCAPIDPATMPIVVLEETKMRCSVIDAVAALADAENRYVFEAHSNDSDAMLAEMDPALMFRVFAGDASAAATRYASYWKHRKMAFGDRYLLPLRDLGGDGALSRRDVEALETGFITFLPEDSSGRQVIFIDCAKDFQGKGDGLGRARSLFFMLSSAALDAEAVVCVRTSNSNDWDPSADALVCGIMSSMPVTIDEVVVLRLCSAGEQPQECALPAQTVLSEGLKFTRASSINCVPDLDLSAAGLPPSAGGTWSYDAFDEWMRDRKRPSEEPPAAEGAEQAKGDIEAEAQQRDKQGTKASVATFAGSLRKRERSAEDVLERQCFALDSANKTLRDESRRLKQLLAEASASIASLVSTNESIPSTQRSGTAPAPQVDSGPPCDLSASEQEESNESTVRNALRLYQQRIANGASVSAPPPDPASGAAGRSEATAKRKRLKKPKSGEEPAVGARDEGSLPFPASANPIEDVRSSHAERISERRIGGSSAGRVSDAQFDLASATQALESQRLAQSALLAERFLNQSNAATLLSQQRLSFSDGSLGYSPRMPNSANPSLSLLSNAGSGLSPQALLGQEPNLDQLARSLAMGQEPNLGQLARSLAMSNAYPSALAQLALQQAAAARLDPTSSLLSSLAGNSMGVNADVLNPAASSTQNDRVLEQLLAEILASRRRANQRDGAA